jgi:PEP-CTERM motif
MKTFSQTEFARSLRILSVALVTLGLWAPHVAKASPYSLAPRTANGDVSRHAPNFTYSIDDGSSEQSIGLTSGGNLLCLNAFATGSNDIITSISIAWGTPAFPDPTLIGLPYTAYLWNDPNGDGSPTDAQVLTSAPGVITSQGTDTFLISSITPTHVTTTHFFVGFVINQLPGQFPASQDTDNPVSNGSWVSLGGNPNNLSDAQTIASVGFPGNWMIRADAVPEPSTYALVGLGLAGIVFLGRRPSRVAK